MARPIPPADATFSRPTSTTDGDQPAKRADRFTNVAIQFAGTFAGGWDLDLEGSINGTDFVSIQATIVAAGVVQVDNHWRWLKVTADAVGTQSDAALTISMTGLST